jgi:cytochrome c oxidase assembly factor CtaG
VNSLLPFHLHLIELLAIVAAGVAHHFVVASTPRRRQAFFALLALAAVVMWPIGDLAASVSLTVATAQRLVIMVFVAPMLLKATPTTVLSKLTRPRPVDFVVRILSHPGVAIVLVTILGTTTLITPVVGWGARSSVGRDLILLAVLSIGFLLWVPALAVMPGAKRLSPAATAGYIFGSAIVVTSLSFVWIFSQHSLYPALHNQYALLHMTPLFDQQLAGFVAKLGCYVPMWAIAFTMFFHAEDQGVSVDESPLHWADVERQLLRIDRQRAKALRRHRPE